MKIDCIRFSVDIKLVPGDLKEHSYLNANQGFDIEVIQLFNIPVIQITDQKTERVCYTTFANVAFFHPSIETSAPAQSAKEKQANKRKGLAAAA